MKCHILVIPKTTLATSNITCNHVHALWQGHINNYIVSHEE